MKKNILLAFLILIGAIHLNAQKRIKPPKNKTNIASVDGFVYSSFNIYNKVFVYDSILKATGDVPSEYDKLEDIEYDLDSIMDVIPEILEDIEGRSVLKQAKATMSVNKARKALTYSGKTIKVLLVGTKEDED